MSSYAVIRNTACCIFCGVHSTMGDATEIARERKSLDIQSWQVQPVDIGCRVLLVFTGVSRRILNLFLDGVF